MAESKLKNAREFYRTEYRLTTQNHEQYMDFAEAYAAYMMTKKEGTR